MKIRVRAAGADRRSTIVEAEMKPTDAGLMIHVLAAPGPFYMLVSWDDLRQNSGLIMGMVSPKLGPPLPDGQLLAPPRTG